MTAWQFCTSGSAISKAGLYANSAIIASGSTLLNWYNEAEGRIETETHTAWSDNYTTAAVTQTLKNILSDVCSSYIAKNIISYDQGAYLSREADTLLNLNDDAVVKGLKALEDKTNHTLRVP